MTPVDTLGEPVTVVDALGEPVVLINEDGTPAFLAYSAKTYLGGVAPYHWLDFINNRALYAGADVGNVTQATGYSFTRASDGYYTNADGTLTLFGSGALRRGDRGVLIEGSRTNLLTYSQEFDDASWATVNATVTANATTAPDGTSTADLLVADTASAQHRLDQTTTIAAAAHTYSVFLKAGGYNFANIRIGSLGVGINLTNGTTNDLSAGCSVLVTALANGWYRLALTRTAPGNDTVRINVTDTATLAGSFVGDGTSGIYIWGAQLEAASFPSSYIPTVAAAATRAADVLTYTAGVSYPLSLWAEFERAVDTGTTEALLRVDDGSTANAMRLVVSTADRVFVDVNADSVGQGNSSPAQTIAVGAITKGAARADTDSNRACANGTLGPEDTSATLPSDPTRICVGSGASGTEQPFGYIRRAAIFNSALTDAQLQTVTS
jgi:hypothetical protein